MKRNYAKAFRIVRAAFGLRQSELAARVPITASQLSLIEAGKRQPSLRVVEGLAAAVALPPDREIDAREHGAAGASIEVHFDRGDARFPAGSRINRAFEGLIQQGRIDG